MREYESTLPVPKNLQFFPWYNVKAETVASDISDDNWVQKLEIQIAKMGHKDHYSELVGLIQDQFKFAFQYMYFGKTIIKII